MREIKFRAWDNDLKVMLYQNHFSSFFGCDSSDGQKNRHDRKSFMTWNGLCYHEGKLLNLTLEQYTGLKDKNGVEIYEGDIVRFKTRASVEKQFPIEFSPLYGYRPYQKGYGGFDDWLGYHEVIGNIHQNPEAIGKKEINKHKPK